jgi:hypothetical protein
MRTNSRSGARLLSGGALVLLLGACSFSWAARGTGTSASSASSAGSSSAEVDTSVDAAGAGVTVSIASCSGNSCSVTLGGPGSRVMALGTTISFVGIRNGRASVQVGGRTVSLAEDETVSLDRQALRCTGVTSTTVTMVVSPA